MLDPQKLNTDDQIAAEVSDFIASIRQTAPRQPGQPVLIPGDPERAKRAAARQHGVELNQAIADQLNTISAELGVTVPEVG